MKRSKFSLSHHKLLTCDMGQLVPIGLTEVLPGDSIQHAVSLLLRVSPLLAPVMHPVRVRIHNWFVPHRLVWDNWEDFITGGPDNDDDSEFPTVAVTDTSAASGSLADYLGIPTPSSGKYVSALPFRGYNLIWNEWYRDQDLETELAISRADGIDSTTSKTLQNASWEKDNYTSSRPWPQKGPDVTIPLGTTAPVQSTGENIQLEGDTDTSHRTIQMQGSSLNELLMSGGTAASLNNMRFADQTGLEVDLTGATAIDINSLREAFALQRFAEARARYGSRYTEYLRYLGVRSSDARLQRPEYLGGGKQTIQFSEVLQTGVTTDGDDSEGVGNLKGHGISAIRSNRYRRFFEEHGYIFSLLSVRPKTMYMQGVPRTFNRRTREDFFQKELQHIGQQEILAKELYINAADGDAVFGYQDRYDEYRRSPSTVSGDFRNTLKFWHMAREFSSEPTLNGAFVKCTPTKRINAVQDEDTLWIMAHHSMQARRLLSKRGSSFTY